MKYVIFTYVDASTHLPLSKEPARTGPVILDGVNRVFDIESTYTAAVPIMYGTVADNFNFKLYADHGIREISEAEFIECFRTELLNRANVRHKELLRQGIQFRGVQIPLDKDTIQSIFLLYTANQYEQTTGPVNFRVNATEWMDLLPKDILELGARVHYRHQQSWTECNMIHELVKKAKTVEQLQEEENNIRNWYLEKMPDPEAKPEAAPPKQREPRRRRRLPAVAATEFKKKEGKA